MHETALETRPSDEWWPICVAMYFTFLPAAIKRDAKTWRQSWKRILVTPAP